MAVGARGSLGKLGAVFVAGFHVGILFQLDQPPSSHYLEAALW